MSCEQPNAVVWCGEGDGLKKDGAPYKLMLDISKGYKRPVARGIPQKRLIRRIKNVLARGYCASMSDARLYSYDGNTVRCWHYWPASGAWSDGEGLVPTSDACRVIRLCEARGAMVAA